MRHSSYTATDALYSAGAQARLPVMGVFEIADDRILAWRDYFDRDAFVKALG